MGIAWGFNPRREWEKILTTLKICLTPLSLTSQTSSLEPTSGGYARTIIWYQALPVKVTSGNFS
ncbi:MAG: hypothetical protein DSM106950_38210 [Stigonema ocellatum SAG 48.90 = DSM 106950]|nr:hypothetical protein [Stigonema ocellatum SAG 48.90 = DSM 106950]